MRISIVAQPQVQLGQEIAALLDQHGRLTKITIVSAFAALRTVLRLRERLWRHAANGARLRLTLGIDLGGTSREVLAELLTWNCETFVFHNAVPRSTFHPKLYLFEAEASATLFVGSNNLTDGGLYSNYEAATRCDFTFPQDAQRYQDLTASLASFLEPAGPTVRPLDAELLRILIERNDVPSEAEAKQRRAEQARMRPREPAGIPSPFAPVATPRAPLLPEDFRRIEPQNARKRGRAKQAKKRPYRAEGWPGALLVWKKKLSSSDALQVNPGSNHVGGARLTQGIFRDAAGERIDQTRYFRELFADYDWEPEVGHTKKKKEHTFIPMRLVIRDSDYDVHDFEVSHKPSGEAGQDNYTTILRWGKTLTPVIRNQNLTGAVLSLYETPDDAAEFLIDIQDA